MIGIFVPTLGRPASSQRFVDNVAEATDNPWEVVFVTEEGCEDDREACEATGCRTLVSDGGSYSNAIQVAYEASDHEFFICANDDFDFQPHWDSEALKQMVDGIDVVAINDGAPACTFSTIALVRRSYIDEQSGVIDMPRRVQYPYHHNFVDTEFFWTAHGRGVVAIAPSSVVVHRHPDWGYATYDETHRKGQQSLAQDALTFDRRRHLWESLPTWSIP